MFSAAPWAQQCRSHEGLRFGYTGKTFLTDVTLAATREYKDWFDPRYSPVASHNYQWMIINNLVWRPSQNWTLTGISSLEFFNDPSPILPSFRGTSGGRFEFGRGKNYVTGSFFYQYGQMADGKTISAYYFQPEYRATFRKTVVRVGAEVLAGQDQTINRNHFGSFVPPYGVAWKFMGNMNFFANFPNDVGNSGLINPYVFFFYYFKKDLFVRADAHGFFLQHPLPSPNKELGSFLGLEFDLSAHYRLSSKFDFSFGVSSFSPTMAMENLGKVPDHEKIPMWSYLMVTYSPMIFSQLRQRGK